MRHEAEQLGLFEEGKCKNEDGDLPWKKSQTARMLDDYLGGADITRIAHDLERTPKSVKRRLEQFTYNEFDRAVRYEPFRRLSRKGKRITENERLIIQAHKDRNVSVEATAKLLMRDVHEIKPDEKGSGQVVDAKQVAPSLDLVM